MRWHDAGMDLYLTGDPAADTLLSRDPLALLLGMLLDQQVTMESAFAGPQKLVERLGDLDAASIAAMDPEEFARICATPPAIHRFPGSMAGRIQAVCATVTEDYDGDASGIWTVGSPDGAEVLRRLKALPGFGDQKARIFLALLGKQYGLDAEGWQRAAGDYAEPGSYRSVADIVDAESLAQVRATKQAVKAAAKAAKA